MSQIQFYKYQGTGNDFIILLGFDGADFGFLEEKTIQHLCRRRTGIGADGLMILTTGEGANFHLEYFNADGKPGSLCGNGSRCAVAIAHRFGHCGKECTFSAFDGLHRGRVKNDDIVEIEMMAVENIEKGFDTCVLDTGSPHYVAFCDDLALMDIVSLGREVRYSDRFKAEGINVNYVSEAGVGISVRTYERGVEDETLSCGTGVTASALAYHLHASGKTGTFTIPISTSGGDLQVSFSHDAHGAFRNIWLSGPATPVFEGIFEIGIQ